MNGTAKTTSKQALKMANPFFEPPGSRAGYARHPMSQTRNVGVVATLPHTAPKQYAPA